MQRAKYPRTYHLPWSPGRSSDDKVHAAETVETMFAGKQVVVSEKLDGENCSIYSDGTCHARSIDSKGHESRTWVKALAARLAADIPHGWRLCGENLYAEHSISYTHLPGYFVLFSVWDERNRCLPWSEMVEWAELWGLPVASVLYEGTWDAELLQGWHEDDNTYIPSEYGAEGEGYVVRLADGFAFEDFGRSVAKWVRAGHVQTDTHWMHQAVSPNGLAPWANGG